jgi:hypothetical protein
MSKDVSRIHKSREDFVIRRDEKKAEAISRDGRMAGGRRDELLRS